MPFMRRLAVFQFKKVYVEDFACLKANDCSCASL